MRIRTIHQSLTVTVNPESGETRLVEFLPVEEMPGVFEGEVDDAVGEMLLRIRRSPHEYRKVPSLPAPMVETQDERPSEASQEGLPLADAPMAGEEALVEQVAAPEAAVSPEPEAQEEPLAEGSVEEPSAPVVPVSPPVQPETRRRGRRG